MPENFLPLRAADWSPAERAAYLEVEAARDMMAQARALRGEAA